jgi:colanic acid biosynthesis protein WcaH
MNHLDDDLFHKVIQATPLIAVDLVFYTDQKILLGKRTNKPAQGYWFVPGGRIYKDDTIERAIERVALKETGSVVKASEQQFLGVYEHHYPDNVFGDPDFGTYYVVLAYLIGLAETSPITGDDQHDELQWWRMDDAVDSDLVHDYTKIYLQKLKPWK